VVILKPAEFIQPSIFSGVKDDMKIAHEKVCSPFSCFNHDVFA